ncbi:7534_t:CDS:1, partial [Scutellospora calospora]
VSKSNTESIISADIGFVLVLTVGANIGYVSESNSISTIGANVVESSFGVLVFFII